MSKEYKVTSQEGADRYGAELDAVVTLTLPVDERRAVVAAGWLEEVEEPEAAPAKAATDKKGDK